jgi:hypothetical protein
MICLETRENHGDKQHEFSEDGQLVQKKPADPPKKNAPEEKVPDAFKAKALTTLVEILAEKGVLGAPDIIRIFDTRS